MPGFPQPDDRFGPPSTQEAMPAQAADRPFPAGSAAAASPAQRESLGNRALEAPELVSALQLLVERAQYITGATGTALALPHGDEMVCRASAGSSAPAVGARLQVVSGLTGESISRRQLLRCDNAETDPRVNLEACRALGIASIVVLPLFRKTGEVRGLIELFSDHPYAFEERDLVALERMADLTLTALDMAEERQGSAPVLATQPQAMEAPAESSGIGLLPDLGELKLGPELNITTEDSAVPVKEGFAEVPPISAPSKAASPPAIPEAMRRMQKCASCGFPVSEGRTLCLDCEKSMQPGVRQKSTSSQPAEPSKASVPTSEEFIPAFLANAPPVSESWLSNHVNILAIIVLILAILVAVVVFR